MNLVIIRHPETNALAGLRGKLDEPSPAGRAQLNQIADICGREHVQTVVHSVVPRAAIAGEMLARELDVPHLPQAGLQERDFGDWNDREWPQIAAELDKLSLEERYMFVPPNGESWQQMEIRLRAALRDITALGYDSVALMMHVGSIRALLPIVRREPKESTLQLMPEYGQVFMEEYEI